MPRFADSAKRDPYRNFNFRIKFGNDVVAACRKVSALDATVHATTFRAGDSRTSVVEKMPGRTEFGDVTIEEGVTGDPLFETWANQLIDQFDRPTRLQDPLFRREITIDVMDLDHTTVARSYVLHRAWPSKYIAMSDLAGDGNDVIIATLTITHEGYQRVPDPGVQQ
jgi:phage tail-like protein